MHHFFGIVSNKPIEPEPALDRFTERRFFCDRRVMLQVLTAPDTKESSSTSVYAAHRRVSTCLVGNIANYSDFKTSFP